MKPFWKSFCSLLIAMLLYEGMVIGLHLLNLPSNLAVLAGVCLLLVLAAVGWTAFGRIWR